MTRNGARLDHEGLNVEKVSQDGAKILIKKGEETFRSHSTYLLLVIIEVNSFGLLQD